MKALNNYITEKLHINTSTKIEYMYHPKDMDELIKCIKDKIEKEGLGTKENPLNLNDIDTSKITDMSYLFDISDGLFRDLSTNGYFDISDWDVNNVITMHGMFYGSHFDGDISDWDVSNVEDMQWMFAWSKFNGDISDWDVSNVTNMSNMFRSSKFNADISKWNVSKVENMKWMFGSSPLQKNPPKWYKS